MIDLNDAKMKAITRFIIGLMRDYDIMYNCYVRGMEDEQDVDLMDVIAYLYEIIHQLYYHTPYHYMFYWANKIGTVVEDKNIDMLINNILEEEEGL